MSHHVAILLTAALAVPLSSGCQHTHAPPDLASRYTPVLDYSTLTLQPATIEGPVSAEVQGVVVRRAAQLRYCYDRQVQLDPDVGSGEVIVSFEVDATGRVGLVDVEDHGVDADVALCIASRFHQMRFDPSAGASTRVRQPIALTRARSSD